MKIPLPGLMRKWREEEFKGGGTPAMFGLGLKLWGALAKRPRLYHAATRLGITALSAWSFGRGKFRSLPLARGWTKHRDMPAPQKATFQALWAEHKAGVPR
jgi:L-lactate dehydrogenase complex protein LldF